VSAGDDTYVVTDSSARVPLTRLNPIRFLGRENGLPSVQVHDVTLDAQNVLWVVGPNGLARVEGPHVRVIGRNEGLRSHGLRCVTAHLDGTTWVGGDAGVDVINVDGTVRDNTEPWKYGVVEKLCILSCGDVWAATAHGLVRYSPDDGWHVSVASVGQNYIKRITLAPDGILWAAGNVVGLLIEGPNGFSNPAHSDWQLVGQISTIAAGPNGSMFVGGSKGAAEFNLNGSLIRRLRTIPASSENGNELNIRAPDSPKMDGDYEGNVSALISCGDELWVGIDGKLAVARLVENEWHVEEAAHRRLSVNAMATDTTGSIACATESSGVAIVSAVRHALTRTEFPDTEATLCIVRDGDDYLIGGDGPAWKIRIAGDAPNRTVDPIFRGARVWDLLQRKDGTLWAATQDGVFMASPSGKVEQIGQHDPVLNAPARVLAEHNGGVLAGTISGLVEIHSEWHAGPSPHSCNTAIVRTFVDANGDSIGYTYCIAKHKGDTWVGTLGNGLWLIANDGCKRLTGDGLVETGNTMSIAFRGTSAFVLQDNRLLRIDIVPDGGPNAPTLHCSVIATSSEAAIGWALAFDHHDRLWVGSPSGLKSYDRNDGELLRNISVWMGRDGWEFTTSRSLVVDHLGRLLCGLNSGLTIVDIDKLDAIANKPKVTLSEVRWIGANVTKIERAPDEHHASITATATPTPTPTPTHEVNSTFDQSHRTDQIYSMYTYLVDRGPWSVEIDVAVRGLLDETIAYQFRLVGFDDAWSQSTTVPTIRYTSLPVGTYSLEARGHSPIAGWGEVASVTNFEVRPSTWREVDDPVHLTALFEDRLRISRDLHDNVVQRLFVTGMELDALSRQLPDLFAPLIHRAISQLDEAIREVRVVVSSLAQQSQSRTRTLANELLSLCLQAKRLSNLSIDAKVADDFALSCPERIGVDVVAVAREAIANIVRHSKATQATFRAEVDHDHVVLTVSDNGVGLSDTQNHLENRTGHGLRNLAARATELGGTLSVTSHDEAGTTLHWVVPINLPSGLPVDSAEAPSATAD
jgi:ligand-binding sensor domain-containing protein/two-component sensor histidine kinase